MLFIRTIHIQFNLHVLDHVIIGDGRYISLKEEGYIN
ncbi:JAB domain-containing protein [Methanococcoides burtonii]